MTEVILIGNAAIASCPEFRCGHTTGYLQFYDERYRQHFPLTSITVCQHLMAIWDEEYSSEWKAGCIVGWLEGLFENSPETFMSMTIAEFDGLGVKQWLH
jgi:hypothetical protein